MRQIRHFERTPHITNVFSVLRAALVRPTIPRDGAAGWAIITSAHVLMWARFWLACKQQAARTTQAAKAESTSCALDEPMALAAKRRRLSRVGSTWTELCSY